MVERRQISEAEKQDVLARRGRRCFIDNAPLEADSEVEFDHIIPFAEGGRSEPGNIGAVCKKHNREKGTLSLSEYRDRLELRRFFEGAKKRRLDDLLEARLGPHGHGAPLQVEVDGNRATLYLDGGSIDTPVGICPATNEKFFFASLPVATLSNDVDLQPRPLEPERVWELYRHLRTHTQLA
jgi:HNH endonuclease